MCWAKCPGARVAIFKCAWAVACGSLMISWLTGDTVSGAKQRGVRQ